jgi:NTE family protein
MEDVERTLNHPAWINRKPPQDGVLVLDCTRDLQPAPEAEHENS